MGFWIGPEWSGIRKLSRNTLWLKSVLPSRVAFTNRGGRTDLVVSRPSLTFEGLIPR